MKLIQAFGKDLRARLGRIEGRTENMSAMMDRLGIDIERFSWRCQGRELHDAIRTCRSCSAYADCTRWLADAPERVKSGPAFCPNGRRFS
jgi:hypothetical protein